MGGAGADCGLWSSLTVMVHSDNQLWQPVNGPHVEFVQVDTKGGGGIQKSNRTTVYEAGNKIPRQILTPVEQ